jgi:RNA polymerase sigma factor (sigma-70 family)
MAADTLSHNLMENLESRPLPPDAMIREESVRRLLLAITSLSASEQQLIFAFYFEGRPQADIAEELGVSVKGVESQLYRIRNRLRVVLSSNERT